jgi:hypothetical protein
LRFDLRCSGAPGLHLYFSIIAEISNRCAIKDDPSILSTLNCSDAKIGNPMMQNAFLG